jgi:hypothetical protein
MINNDPSLSPDQQEWLRIRDEHINWLQNEISSLQAHSASLEKTLTNFRQEHVALVQAQQQEKDDLTRRLNDWQRNYESLRVQKGGFGFKALLATGILALGIGLLAGWIFFSHKDPDAVVFSQFEKEAGFQLEYALAQKQYTSAAAILENCLDKKSNQAIAPQVKLIQRLVSAVKLSADTTYAGSIGYSLTKDDSVQPESLEPVRQLVITAPIVPLHQEALSTSPVLLKLKKKDKIGQWDRTPEPEKIRLSTEKNIKGEAEDFWYEVETTDGIKGWVFGYYTNASLKKFVPDSIPVVKPPTDSVK